MKIPIYLVKHLPTAVILASQIIYENLNELGLNIDWLKNEMKNQNTSNINELLYAEVKGDGSLYIIKR